RAVTGRADITDVLAGGHLVTGRYVNAGLPHVPVRRRDRLAGDGVRDDDEAAVTTAELRDGDGAVGGGQDRRTVGCGAAPAGAASTIVVVAPVRVVRMVSATGS